MAFRLLDLPLELRYDIFDIVFLDHSPSSTLNLVDVKKYVPKADFTRVNRQLRQESLPLHRKATRKFWSTHNLTISIDCTKTKKSKRQRKRDMLIDLAQLRTESRSGMQVTNLTFFIHSNIMTSFPGMELELFVVEVHAASDGKPVWKCVADDSRLPAQCRSMTAGQIGQMSMNRRIFALNLQAYLERMLKQWKAKVSYKAGDERGAEVLNVAACLRAVLGNF